MARYKDADWSMSRGANKGDVQLTWEMAQTAVLMDLRDELKALHAALLPLRHLDCSNFIAIPATLRRIARNTAKPRKKKR